MARSPIRIDYGHVSGMALDIVVVYEPKFSDTLWECVSEGMGKADCIEELRYYLYHGAELAVGNTRFAPDPDTPQDELDLCRNIALRGVDDYQASGEADRAASILVNDNYERFRAAVRDHGSGSRRTAPRGGASRPKAKAPARSSKPKSKGVRR